MKRPQGFQPTAAPARPPGRDPAAPTRSSARRGAPSRDQALTEPIRLDVDERSAAAVPMRAQSEPRESARAEAVPSTDAAAAASPTGTAMRDVRAARRALAAAERRRRRYERQEVRRFTRRGRLRRMTWLAGLAAVAALALLAVGVAYSPLMALREIRVEGASRVPAADIRAAFDDRLGTPLPLITTDEVRGALSEFPLIETYSTETVPPGTLVVRIVERTPVGVVETASGLVTADAAGVVIERVEAAPEGLPLVNAEGGLDGDAYRAAGAVLRSLPAELRAQVAQVTADTPDDVRLELAEGAVVVWGSADESSLKATVLARLMAAAPPEDVGGYDVSAPLSAVVY